MYPRLLHIYGPLWVQSYGAMIAVGFLTFLYLTLKHPLRKKFISNELFLNAVFLGLASGVIGGRVLYVIAHPGDFAGNWIEVFYPWVGGGVVLGSILGVLITVPIYLYVHAIPTLPMLDLAALYTPLMQSISRFGCLFAGCCYGAAAPHLWCAITFTNPESQAPLYVPLHPTQIYMALASLCIFFIIQLSSSKLLKKSGAASFAYLTLENLSRFTVDFWRGDREPYVILSSSNIGLSYLQILSALGFAISLIVFIGIMLYQKPQE